jgi:hypothetical protein
LFILLLLDFAAAGHPYSFTIFLIRVQLLSFRELDLQSVPFFPAAYHLQFQIQTHSITRDHHPVITFFAFLNHHHLITESSLSITQNHN